MKTFIKFAVVCLAALAGSAWPASANKFDVKTVTCAQLIDTLENGSASDKTGMGAIIYWIAGYSGPSEQSTVVDFTSLGKDFERVLTKCKEQPNIGIMTIAEQIFGEDATPTGPKAVDIATITCKAALDTPKEDEEGLGFILMWLAGYHAYGNESTIFDPDQFSKESTELDTYCQENKELSLFTASEATMAEK